MNKIKWSVLFVLICISAQRASALDPVPGPGFVIKGTIKGIRTGMVRLKTILDQERGYLTVDSTMIKDGSFTFTGTLSGSQMMMLTIDPGNWSMEVFIENAPLTIEADTAGAVYTSERPDGVKEAIIQRVKETGSSEYTALMAFRNDPRAREFDKIIARYSLEIDAAKEDKEQYRLGYLIDSVSREKDRDLKKRLDVYSREHAGSVAGVYLLQQWFQDNHMDVPLDELEETLGHFTGKAKESRYYTYLIKKVAVQRAILPGKTAPDFTLSRKDGTLFTLSSTRGKYLLIDFWASWCIFCRKEIPHWKEVYKKYQAQGLDVLSLSLDRDNEAWYKAMDAEQMPWTQVVEDFSVKGSSGKVAEVYDIHSIPCYVLLDKEGKILVREIGATFAIDAKLKELFEK